MPLEAQSCSELGSIDPNKNEFRAHLQLRDESSKKAHICGPNRTTEEQAQKDLEQIRKAAEKAETREEGLEMMRNEAQKLKEAAQYEAEIRDTLRRRDSMADESDYEDDDMSDNSEPPWIQEYQEEVPESTCKKDSQQPEEKSWSF